jgi:type II secretory ATPase GspE/PulE/Tfp pilus assembly ATPase PilB-like protein
MEMLGFVERFSTAGLLITESLATALPFNPVRFLALIVWVYLCLYCVQRVEFSPLVPKHRKGIANIITLFTGPLLLILLIVGRAVKKSAETRQGVLAALIEQFQTAFENLKASKGAKAPKITLLDSSGRSMKEVYGAARGGSEDSSVLRLTEQIVYEALEDRASDILIDPRDSASYTVRFRVDGILRIAYDLEAGVAQAIINSIKAISGMDIAERRRPQDGAFTAQTEIGTPAFRAASAGVIQGEKLAVRVLNTSIGDYTLTSAGLTQKQQGIIRQTIARPSGTVLMCGPTGSGKTTSLYAMLNEIDFFTRNVVTVEDPIECTIPNVSQIEVNPKADITFAKSLRSILRQDPDVICVGEVRDEETAAIALRAAQTGHLVLATIHCDTNASALIRLFDLGVSPLLLASGLNVVVGQRLLRRLCDECKRPAKLLPSEMDDYRRKGIDYTGMYQPVGCPWCSDTGYRGRIGVFDILVLDDRLKSRIANGELSVAMLQEEDGKKGKSNLYKQGLRLVVSGVTSMEELKRVVG